MVIIESHLFSQFVLFGIDETRASWAFSVYGIATIIGALLSGFLSIRLHKGNLLGFYYGFRAVWVLTYVWLMPKNMVTAVLFAIGLGMTGDATVSPTSGLVSENFSVRKVATLIGILFFTHQIGAFFSAWLGGLIRQAMGNYTVIWMIDVVLCIFASVMSFRIKVDLWGRQRKKQHDSSKKKKAW
jgi:predicted MFS family arabinose efflux permease